MNLWYSKWRNFFGLVFIVVLCAFIFFNVFVSPNPKGKSPKSIVKLYYKARNSGKTELLKKIIYFPPETTEEQKQAKVESILAGSEEKLILRSMGIRITVKYQKYIDDDTAEVGTMSSSIFLPWKQYPADQIILKKQDGVWKYSHIIAELPKEILIENLKNNSEDTDLYFHLARAYIPENPAKSHRYYLKYYELDPDGFWVDEDFLRRLKEYREEYEDTENYEQQILEKVDRTPANHILSKTIEYQRLCQLFMEKKDYKKANYYITLAEETLKKDMSEYNYWKKNLDEVKNELELRINGKYVDPLDEIEKSRRN